jgi:putative Mg2+ transporter-C (MgtC) family protein
MQSRAVWGAAVTKGSSCGVYDFASTQEGKMPLTLTGHEIAVRLALSVVAGALIGLDRRERGGPAGLRTTLLVCLASAVAMIQTNLLLATKGRTPDSFIRMDLMRLPWRILTGVGFIGGGAIPRRDGFVLGATTAATLWFVTVIGLCFGVGRLHLACGFCARHAGALWSALVRLPHETGTTPSPISDDGAP